MGGTKRPVTNIGDTFGRDEPTDLPCHVAVNRERDRRYRVWVYFAGAAFAVWEPTADYALAFSKAAAFRDGLANCGANVSGLISTPEDY